MAWPNPYAANTNMSPWNQSGPAPRQLLSGDDMGGAGYPENYESMQQWQQWAQWQQQYAQWHNQYGDKYAAQLAAIQTMTTTGRPPLPQTSMVAGGPVPPPPDEAPPPPPPHENDLPLFGQQSNSSFKDSPASVPLPALPASSNNSAASSYNASNSGNTQNWSQGLINPIENTQTVYNSEALQKLAEEERTFDIQFKKWEQEIEAWKQDNMNHPDKHTYNEYKEKYEACRKQLLLRREQMQQKKRKLLEKSTAVSDPAPFEGAFDAVSKKAFFTSYSSPQTPNFRQNQNESPNSGSSDSHNKNIEPQDRYDVNEEYQSSVYHADFLPTKAAGKSIPGLDLVAEEESQKQPEVIEIPDDNSAANSELDYSKISMGINSILEDKTIMSMLSMVASRQNLKTDNRHQQHYPHNNANNSDNLQNSNTWDKRNDMCDNRQNNSFNSHGSYDRQQGLGQSLIQQHEHALNHAQNTLEHNKKFNNAQPVVLPNYGRYPGPQSHNNYSAQGPEYVPHNQDQGYINQDRMPYHKNTQNQGRMEFNQERQYPPPLMQQNNDQRMFNQDKGPRIQNLIQQNPERTQYSQNRMPHPLDRMTFQDRNPDVISYNQENNMSHNNQNQNRMPYNQDQMQLNRDQAPLQTQGNTFNQQRNVPNQNMGRNNANEPNAVAPSVVPGQNGDNMVQNVDDNSEMNQPEEDYIFTPDIIVDYEHVSLRLEERNFIEALTIKDYNHVSDLDLDAEKIYEAEFEEKPNFGKRRNSNNFDNNIKDDRNRERIQRSIVVEQNRERDYRNSRDREHRGSRERDFGDSRDRDRRHSRERGFRDSREPDYSNGRERDYRDTRDKELRGGREPDIRSSRDANSRDTRDSTRVYMRRPPREDERLPRGVDSYNDRMRSNERPSDSYGYRKNEDRDRYARREEAPSRPWDPNRYRLDRRDDNRSNSTDSDYSRKRGSASDHHDDSKKPRVDPKPDVVKNIIMIDDILEPPGRDVRPDKILIILRGPPGSGKSYLAKLIKDRENEYGGSARIMSIDDYFMQESEVDEVDPATGKTVKKMVLSYEYDAKSEESYEGYLKKSIKKTITDGYFSFLIYDAVNASIQAMAEIAEFAKHNQFKVYTCTMEAEPTACWRRNVHGRTQADVEALCARFESTPSHWLALDAATLLQRAAIDDVDMEDADPSAPRPADQTHQPHQPGDATEVESSFTSKWEKMDDAAQLARLDGTSRPLRPSHLTMGDYLQLDEWQPTQAKPGKKTVRWADIEERREQEKMRAIGFVVGQTDWGRMTDPTMGSSALTQTKYIERVRRN